MRSSGAHKKRTNRKHTFYRERALLNINSNSKTQREKMGSLFFFVHKTLLSSRPLNDDDAEKRKGKEKRERRRSVLLLLSLSLCVYAVSRVVLSLMRSQKYVKKMRKKGRELRSFFSKKIKTLNCTRDPPIPLKTREKNRALLDSRARVCVCVCVCVRFRTQKRNERQRRRQRRIWRRNTSATRCSTRSSVRKGTSCASIATRPTRSGRRRRFACSCVSIAPGCTDRSECTSRR